MFHILRHYYVKNSLVVKIMSRAKHSQNAAVRNWSCAGSPKQIGMRQRQQRVAPVEVKRDRLVSFRTCQFQSAVAHKNLGTGACES